MAREARAPGPMGRVPLLGANVVAQTKCDEAGGVSILLYNEGRVWYVMVHMSMSYSGA